MQDEIIERRMSPRTRLTQLMRIRPLNAGAPTDYCTTFDVSRTGIYFRTSASHYEVGKKFYVARDFVVADPNREETIGAVVRIDKLEDGSFGVAVHFMPAP
jgi:hypothetical protein